MRRKNIRNQMVTGKKRWKRKTNRPKSKQRRSGRTQVKRKWRRRKLQSRRRSITPDPLKKLWMDEAYAAGERDAALHPFAENVNHKKHINQYWSEWLLTSRKNMGWTTYYAVARSYLSGFIQRGGSPVPDWILAPTNKNVAAIITVMNEEKTITSVLRELQRLPLEEIIVVVNGSEDNSLLAAREISDAIIIHYTHPIGHDVGRAIGAKIAQSDILLFMDGDFPILAEHLVPFIAGIDQGLDIALNNITPYLGSFSTRDSVSVMKEFANRSMSRPDLGANSLTAVPHAISRRAVEQIGYHNLIVPPKAHVIAIQQGLNIGAPFSVDVITKNKVRAKNSGRSNPVAGLIIGDHLEAMSYSMKMRGERLTFPDLLRNREIVGGNKQ